MDRETLSILIETRYKDAGIKAAEKATAGLASSVDKAGDQADSAAKRADSAFGKIESAIRSTRSEASKGAEFDLKASESGMNSVMDAIGRARSDAAKGADFTLRASGGVGSLSQEIASVRQAASRGAVFEVDTGSSESKLSGLKDSMKEVASVAGGVVLGDMAGGGIDGLSASLGESARSAGQLQAQLGLTKGQAEDLKRVGLDVYTSNWGTSIGDVTTSLATVQNGLRGLGASKSELQGLTESALIVRDVVGVDVTESVDAARQMTQNFGIEGQQAFDLIIAGSQQGANASGDMVDSLREYSPYFSEIGLSADQAMATFVAGAKNGIRNTDVLADGIKEFSIRAVDGSKLTAEGFQAAGLDADKMAAAIAEGGPAAEKAFKQTLDGLQSIKDPRKREQAGVALFGTMYEDLGPKMLKSMDQGSQGMKNVEGSTKKAGDALSDNFGSKLAGVIRKSEVFVTETLGISGGLGEVAEVGGGAGMAVGGFAIAAKTAAPVVGGLGTKLKNVINRLLTLSGLKPPALTPPVVPPAQPAKGFWRRVPRTAPPTVAPTIPAPAPAKGFWRKMPKTAPPVVQPTIPAPTPTKAFWRKMPKTAPPVVQPTIPAPAPAKGFWKRMPKTAPPTVSPTIPAATPAKGFWGRVPKTPPATTPPVVPAPVPKPGFWGSFTERIKAIGKSPLFKSGAQAALWIGAGIAGTKVGEGKIGTWVHENITGPVLFYAKRGKWSELGAYMLDNFMPEDAAALTVAATAPAVIGIKNAFKKEKWSELGGNVWGGIKRGFNSKSREDGLTEPMAGIYQGIKDWWGIKSPSTKMISVGSDIMRGLQQGMNQIPIVGGVLSKMGEIRTAVVSRLSEAKIQGLARANELGTGLNTRFTTIRTGASQKFAGVRQDISARLTEAKEQGSARVRELGTNLTTSFTNQRNEANTKYAGIRDSIGNRLNEGKERGSARIRELGSNLITSFTNQRSEADQKYGAMRDTVSNRLSEAKERGTARIRELGSNLIDSFTNQNREADSKYSNMRETIGNRLNEAKERGSARVRELGSNMFESWDNQKTRALEAYQGIRDNMTNPIDTAKTTLQGIWNSILDGISKVLGAVNMDDLAGKVSGAKWAHGGTTEDGGGKAFARGGIAGTPRAVSKFAAGGMGTTSAQPRMHLWNEQQGGEAFIAERRPAKEQLPYLQTAADWHGYAVVPTSKKSQSSLGPHAQNAHAHAYGGVEGATIGVYPFAGGGIGAMYEQVKAKFGIEGFNNHGSYLSEPAASNSLDFMVTTPGSRAEGSQKALGDDIAAFVAPPSTVTTIWYGMANYGGGWQGYSSGPGVGNSNTLLHYDHVHAEAHPDQFRGAQGTFSGGSGGGFMASLWDTVGSKIWDSTVGKIWDAFKEKLPNFALAQGIGGAGDMILDGIKEKVIAESGTTSGGDLPGGNSPSGLTIGEALKQGGWPDDLLVPASSTVWHESTGNASARNPSGARGLMQIMPTTASGVGADYDKLDDPIYNTATGLKVYNQAGGWGPWVGAGNGGDYRSKPVTGYAAGGIIPGQAGKEVWIQAHAGERVLPRDVVTAFDGLSESVRTWARNAQTSGSTNSASQDIEVSVREDVDRMVGAIREQSDLIRKQTVNQARATARAIFEAQKTPKWWQDFDEVFSAMLEDGNAYIAGAN